MPTLTPEEMDARALEHVRRVTRALRIWGRIVPGYFFERVAEIIEVQHASLLLMRAQVRPPQSGADGDDLGQLLQLQCIADTLSAGYTSNARHQARNHAQLQRIANAVISCARLMTLHPHARDAAIIGDDGNIAPPATQPEKAE